MGAGKPSQTVAAIPSVSGAENPAISGRCSNQMVAA
jgi:hypothetical protein